MSCPNDSEAACIGRWMWSLSFLWNTCGPDIATCTDAAIKYLAVRDLVSPDSVLKVYHILGVRSDDVIWDCQVCWVTTLCNWGYNYCFVLQFSSLTSNTGRPARGGPCVVLQACQAVAHLGNICLPCIPMILVKE